MQALYPLYLRQLPHVCNIRWIVYVAVNSSGEANKWRVQTAEIPRQDYADEWWLSMTRL
jgi:hypothetical protein